MQLALTVSSGMVDRKAGGGMREEDEGGKKRKHDSFSFQKSLSCDINACGATCYFYRLTHGV